MNVDPHEKLPTVTSSDASATQQNVSRTPPHDCRRKGLPGEKLKIEGLRKRLDTGALPTSEALSLSTFDNLNRPEFTGDHQLK